MYKKQLLLLTGLFISTLIFAQQSSYKDNIKIGKYEIKIKNNTDNTYGYAIYEGKNLIIEQKNKPFLTFPQGFYKKENALVVAKWLVSQLQNSKQVQRHFNLEKAKEIGISDEDLNINHNKTN